MKHVLTLLLILVPAAAFADAKSDAKAHIEKATTFHSEGKYKEALEELTLAYALDPKPELLYAIGQVHVQIGNCSEAISFYERFLATKPAKGPAGAAKEAIQTCKKAPPPVEPTPDPVVEPKPDPQPTPVPITDNEQPLPQPRTKTPFYKDVLGDALVGGGVVAGVLGIVFYTQMNAKLDDAEKADTYKEHDDARDAAASKRTLSIAFGAGGIVLIGAGVARWMLRDTGERPNKVALTPTSDGGLITWFGRF
jgi:tetratricopeptide (TPR) repeat protein